MHAFLVAARLKPCSSCWHIPVRLLQCEVNGLLFFLFAPEWLFSATVLLYALSVFGKGREEIQPNLAGNFMCGLRNHHMPSRDYVTCVDLFSLFNSVRLDSYSILHSNGAAPSLLLHQQGALLSSPSHQEILSHYESVEWHTRNALRCAASSDRWACRFLLRRPLAVARVGDLFCALRVSLPPRGTSCSFPPDVERSSRGREGGRERNSESAFVR